MKKNYKLILICTVIAFWSCEKEVDLKINTETKTVFGKVNLDQIPEIKKVIEEKIERKKMMRENASTYLTKINPKNIITVIDSIGNKSYTFSLNIHESNKMTNLVVLETSNGLSYQLIIYSSTEIDQWKIDIQNKFIKTIIKPNISFQDLDAPSSLTSRTTCQEVTTTWTCPYGIHDISKYLLCTEKDFSEWTFETTYDNYECGGSTSGTTSPNTGDGGGGSISSNGNSIENLITTLNLNSCSESALNKLKAATGVDIAAIINKFDSSTIYNVTIRTSPTSLGTSVAQTNFTNPAIPYDYTINISPDYSESTELFRAATLLHEITHAYFLSLWNDFNAGIQPGSNVYNDNATLFQLYVTHTYPSSNSFDAHHEEMAKTYINSIASALQEFQTGIPVILAGTPNQIYTDLAWGGLKDTPIYNSTFPVGSAERQRIENRYACEQVGHPVGYGTSQQQNTIGKPCQ